MTNCLKNSSQRIFPPIQPTLYSPNQNSAELTSDQKVVQRLLVLSHKEFTRWQLWCGWKLDAEGQLAHLLLQHRLALEAELTAQWQQADFFWNQIYIELQALSEKSWWALATTIAADQPGVAVSNNPIQLRQRLVDELLIDTHCAFYNGLMQQGKNASSNDRAFVHIDYIQQLLAFSGLASEEVAALLQLPWQERLQICRKKGNWKQAVQICSLRLRYLPSIKYQNELAEVNYSAAIAQIGPVEGPVKTLHASHIRIAKHLKQTSRFVLQRVRVSLTPLSQNYLLHPRVAHLWEALRSGYSAAVMRIHQVAEWVYRIQNGKTLQRVMRGLKQLWQKLLHTPKLAQLHQNMAQFWGDLRFNCTRALVQIRQEASRVKQLRDARILRRSILALEKQCQDYPLNLKVFQLLSELHHLRTIKLRNADRLSTALVTVHQAIACNPDYDEPAHLRDELVKDMNQLVAGMNRFKMSKSEQLRTILTNPLRLSGIIQSQRLYQEGKRGFAPMYTYLQSSVAEVTADNFRLAKAINLWRTIGLAEPIDRWKLRSYAEIQNKGKKKVLTQKIDGSVERALLLLLNTVNHVRRQPLTDRASIVEAWQSILAKYPKLADCDPPLVQAFLERQLCGTTDASTTAMSETETRETALTLSDHLSHNTPILIPLSTQPKLEAEPLLPWLFSRQDIRLKAQATIASLLVLTTGGLLIRDSVVRTTRNTAYQQILSAHQQQEYLAVVKGAEAFLSRAPLSGKDDRNQQVKQLYSEALVRWLARQSNQPQPDTQKRIDRYWVLTSNAK